MFFDVSYETHNELLDDNKKLSGDTIKMKAKPIPNFPNGFYPLVYYATEVFFGGIVVMD